MTTKTAHRRVAAFEQQYGQITRRLASHAALPAVLNAELVHLLRINYFLEPPEWLPYTSEADLLLSPLCSEMDDTLYVIDPEVRELLLENLVAEDGPARVQNVARLLWEYTQRHNPWPDLPGLAEAQQLTALNFVDPEKAKAWLDDAEQATKAGTFSDRRWFVAMRNELQWAAKAIVPKQTISRDTAVSKLQDILASLYIDQPSQMMLAREAGLEPWHIAYSINAADTWASILEEANFANRMDDLLAMARKYYPRYLPLLDAIVAYEQAPRILTPQRKSLSEESSITAKPTMSHQEALMMLGDVLAELYIGQGSTRRVVRAAGLDNRHIVYSARPVDTWASVLEQAVGEGSIDKVLAVAQKEYPQFTRLAEAIAAYEQVTQASPSEADRQLDRITTSRQAPASQDAFTKLSNALADLYDRQDSARAVCLRAGLDIRKISFRDASAHTWTAILDEAEKQARVPDLLVVTMADYPVYEPLVTAARNYASASGIDLPPSLTAALSLQDTNAQTAALAELQQEFIGEGLDTALALEDEEARAQALVALAQLLMYELPMQGLITAMAIKNIQLRAMILAEMAQHLRGLYGQNIRNQGLSAALNIEDEQTLAQALMALAPYLPELLVDRGLSADLEVMNRQLRATVAVTLLDTTLLIMDEWQRGRALSVLVPLLVALAPQLPGELLTQVLADALTIRDKRHRAQVLAALAPQLSGEDKAQALAQALAAAQAIRDEGSRADVLKTLAPHLSGELLEQGFVVARAIRNKEASTRALSALTAHRSGDLPQQVPARILATLVEVLAGIYFGRHGAMRVARDAGLDLVSIDFDSIPLLMWRNILNEAGRQGRIPDLLAVAQAEYPQHRPLIAACKSYADWAATTHEQVSSATGRIFLAYSRHDHDYVERLAADIQAHGFGIWYDERIDLGTRWWRTIEQAIETCTAMVVVMSPEAGESEWVEREILLCQQEGKPILPLLLRGEGLPLLINQQYTDVRNRQLPPANFYARLREFVPSTIWRNEQPVSATPHVLIVDDSDNERYRIRRLLAAMDCQVEEARTNAGALDTLSNSGMTFSLLTTDALRRPERAGEEGYAGLDLTRTVNTVFPQLPVVLISRDSPEFLKEQAPDLRVHAFVTKSTSDQELTAVFQKVLAGEIIPNPWVVPQKTKTPQPTPITFDWVEIPAGEFIMGTDPKQDAMAGKNEMPQHLENLATFWIARVPVTVAQFAAFVDATGYQISIPSDIDTRATHPMTNVSWHDAQAFCRWANVRLPTEAEWEKAARGSDGRIYPWGNEKPDKNLCNFDMNVGDTTAVGSYPAGASPYGVLDMSGNVWEWTQTKWRDNYTSPADNRLQGENSRVLRGGSWGNPADWLRCACRDDHDPWRSLNGWGFRVVISPIHP